MLNDHNNTAGSDCPAAPCSALERLAKELDMPADHIRDAVKAMREERLAKAAEELHSAVFTMLRDWKDGDFKVPPLARIHLDALESKATTLGKVLFRRPNSESPQPQNPHNHA